MAYLKDVNVTYSSDALDGFSRLPVAQPQTLFDAQFTYDLQPLLYAQLVSGAGASIAHDAAENRANLILNASSGSAFMQSWEHFRYQPGKAQQIFMTFNFNAFVSNTKCFIGYYDTDSDVGLFFSQESDGLLYFNISSGTSAAISPVVQSNWNLDKLNGTGKSGLSIDITKTQILVIDFQALYVGRVRFGFDIDGVIIWAHEFLNANNQAFPYLRTANLPVSCGVLSTSGSVTRTINFQCCSVVSSGGQDETVGYEFSTPDISITAVTSGTHLVSIRPKTTFNGAINRSKLISLKFDLLVTGNNSIRWEFVLGASFSVAPTYANFNTTYSSWEYGTGGTLTGTPTILVDSGYAPSTASTKGTVGENKISRYPITLDVTGAVRGLGTLSLIVYGLGGSSAKRGQVTIKEIR